ncbi:MAG: hypothetical protein KTR32_25055 [Granulosicoccus sp.]|nr:hypothetical protein [Granulosicoccus sp.]
MKRATIKNKYLIGMAGTLAMALIHSAALAGPVQHTFSTQLEEVRTGHFNGTEYLTIQIPGNVGPASCRGNVLKVDKNNLPSDSHQAIESVALTAMLNEDEVLITVGLERGDCVDGKPTLVDLHVVNRTARR